MENKEYGSDFHFLSDSAYTSNIPFFSKDVQFLFSGRVALYTILKNGIKSGWKKLYVPTYYCHEVYQFINDLSIELIYYDYNPLDKNLNFQFEDVDTNALLVVNYFGIDEIDFSIYKNIAILEDLTHDLAKIHKSKADFVFGSLRKILPLPVGGFLTSNSKFSVELPMITEFSDDVALQKLSAMYLKKKYLHGEFSEKDVFRNLFVDAELKFENKLTDSLLPLILINYLKSLDVYKIISEKEKNNELLSNLILKNDFFTIISKNKNSFANILLFENPENRNKLRNYLITHKIYPAVLWPNQKKPEDILKEENLLFIHVDYRYSSKDMHYISSIINRFIKGNA